MNMSKRHTIIFAFLVLLFAAAAQSYTAILREKNACPKAAIIVLPSILEKSGVKYHLIPSSAPGRLIERRARMIRRMNRRGIKILFHFSIPFAIPCTTMKNVMSMKTAV